MPFTGKQGQKSITKSLEQPLQQKDCQKEFHRFYHWIENSHQFWKVKRNEMSKENLNIFPSRVDLLWPLLSGSPAPPPSPRAEGFHTCHKFPLPMYNMPSGPNLICPALWLGWSGCWMVITFTSEPESKKENKKFHLDLLIWRKWQWIETQYC